jgi:acetyl esterase/lipase
MRRLLASIPLVASAALLLAGCAVPAAQGSVSSPVGHGVSLPPGAVVHRDVAYGADPLQALDVYAPKGAHDDPIILMVHGGGWARGDKATAGVVDNKVAHYLPAGFLVVSTNYRLSPAADPVAEAGDVASALAYVQAHATEWGGSAQRIVLMGHSAGANLVSLLAADPSFAARAGASPWLGTVVLDSAAYDVVSIMEQPHPALYDPVFGHDRGLWRDSSPTLRLRAVPAPMRLVCGAARPPACPQARGFEAAVSAIAAEPESTGIEVYPVELSHGDINSELGMPIALTSTVDWFLASLGLNIVGGVTG